MFISGKIFPYNGLSCTPKTLKLIQKSNPLKYRFETIYIYIFFSRVFFDLNFPSHFLVLFSILETLLFQRGRDYSFGLGKRRQYNFGLGKRNDNTDYPLRLNLDYLPVDNPAFHSQENTDDFLEEKRGRQPYSFGLGKRAVHYSGGQPLGSKRPNDMLSQRYHFGLGKRMPEDEEDSPQ